MDIQLKWDQSQLDQFANLVPKRLAYATVNAISETAKRIQQAEFARARSAFVIRKQQFFFGAGARVGGVAARITKFPSVSKGVYFAEITAGELPQGGDGGTGRRRLLYGRFEAGGTREPFTTGAKSVAVPILGRARPSVSGPVDPRLTFARLQLREFYNGKKVRGPGRWTKKGTGVGVLGEFGALTAPTPTSHAARTQWKGKERTFLAFTAAHPRGAVFQRFGPGKDQIRIIWSFVAPFAIDTRLQFVRTAQATAAGFFAQECDRQLKAVLEHEETKRVNAYLDSLA